MPTTREIATLYARRRRLVNALDAAERRAAHCRAELASVQAELATREKTPRLVRRDPNPLFAFRELFRLIHMALGAAQERPQSADQITAWVMAHKGYSGAETRRAVRVQVYRSMANAAKGGKLVQGGRGQEATWTLQAD